MTIQVRNAELARLLAQDATLTQPTLATFILGATTLDSLSDVITTYATYGDYLRYYGTYSSYYQQITYWVNVPVDTLFEDIKTVNANNGQLLIGNGSGYSVNTLTAGTNITIDNGAGTITINSTASGGATTLDDLTDVTITSPVTGNIIRYDGALWVNVDPTVYLQPLDADLTGLAGLSSTGIVVRTGSGTFTTRSLAAPAAGISISNPDAVSGNPTFALVNDLNALENLASTGIAVRSASDTWVQRTITAGSNISVTNGSGVSGNPTIAVTAAGSDTHVQFNDGGTTLGGDADFTWDKTTNLLSLSGTSISAPGTSQPGLQLIVGNVNTSGHHFPGIKFLSTDSNFTTQNPKLLSTISVSATQVYDGDSDSGTQMSFYLSPDNGGTSSTQYELVAMQGTNHTLSILGGTPNAGVLTRTMSGLELLMPNSDATNNVGPAIKFMSTDTSFTTENPKLLAAMVGFATENYAADTDSGMSIAFYTTPDNNGTTSLPTQILVLGGDGNVAVNSGSLVAADVGKFLVHQQSTTAAIPVANFIQKDVSEEFLRFRGTSANATLTQSIVEDADVTTVTRAGWLKVFVTDDGNQLTDQAYYVPIVTLA